MRPKLLVMDDNADLARSLRAIGEAAGFETIVVPDTRAAPESLRDVAPDAIILDLMMPDRDGIEVLRDIAQLNPNAHVLVISGYGEMWLRMSSQLARSFQLSHVTTRSKPFRAADIRAFLAEVLALRIAGDGPLEPVAGNAA